MARNLEEYYATNYTHCSETPSFFATWQGLAYPSHVIQVISLPVQALTFYLILCRTPGKMRPVKWSLFAFHFWCTVLDFQFCSLITPYFFLPSFACFSLGLFAFFNVWMEIQLALGLFTGFATAVSMIYLYESRSSSIQANKFRMRKKSTKIFYYTFHIVFSCLVFFIFLNSPESQEMAKLDVLKRIPCPIEEFFHAHVYVVLSDPFWINLLLVFVGPVLIVHSGAHISFYCLCCIYYLYIAPSSVTSLRTQQAQRNFFLGILIQTGVPFAIIAVPYVIFTVAVIEDWVTQSMTNLVVITFGLHGMMESLIIILVHHCYRQTVREMFCRKKNSTRANTVVSTASVIPRFETS